MKQIDNQIINLKSEKLINSKESNLILKNNIDLSTISKHKELLLDKISSIKNDIN